MPLIVTLLLMLGCQALPGPVPSMVAEANSEHRKSGVDSWLNLGMSRDINGQPMMRIMNNSDGNWNGSQLVVMHDDHEGTNPPASPTFAPQGVDGPSPPQAMPPRARRATSKHTAKPLVGQSGHLPMIWMARTQLKNPVKQLIPSKSILSQFHDMRGSFDQHGPHVSDKLGNNGGVMEHVTGHSSASDREPLSQMTRKRFEQFANETHVIIRSGSNSRGKFGRDANNSRVNVRSNPNFANLANPAMSKSSETPREDTDPRTLTVLSPKPPSEARMDGWMDGWMDGGTHAARHAHTMRNGHLTD